MSTEKPPDCPPNCQAGLRHAELGVKAGHAEVIAAVEAFLAAVE